MINEEWQASIVRREILDDHALISVIANHLYPLRDLPMAADREARLAAEFPEFVERLRASVNAKLAVNKRLMAYWNARSSPAPRS